MIKLLKEMLTVKGRVITIIITITSVALAHYAGFIMSLPLQIVAATGSTLVSGLTATFIFYIAISAVIARALVAFLQPFYIFSVAIVSRAIYGKRIIEANKKIKYIRAYYDILNTESGMWFFGQILFTLFMMCALYIKLNLTLESSLILLAIIALIITSMLFRAKFLLQCSPKKYKQKLIKNSKLKIEAITALFMTAATALVVCSFYFGYLRMNLLKNDPPQQVSNSYFSGYANFLINSGNATLLYQKDSVAERYIFTSPSFSLAVESKKDHFPKLNQK